MEHQLFRWMALVGWVTSWLIVIPANRFQDLSLWIDAFVALFGLACFGLWSLARRGRYHFLVLHWAFLVTIDGVWITNGGSEGSISIYFGLSVIVVFAFFRGRLRWAMFAALLANAAGIYGLERLFPSLIIQLAPEARFVDAVWGVLIANGCAGVSLWVVLGSFDRERRRLLEANERLAVSLTHRERSDRDRRQLQEQLLQSRKMELVGRLAGGVAHDFNNLLTVITGNVSLALDEVPPDSPLRELLEEAQLASGSAADLTKQLLAFSRKQLVSPRLVELDDVLRGLERMLVRLLGERIVLRLVTGAAARVRIDPVQVEQIVINLAVNARDAMPDGGVLTIATTVRQLDAAFCRAHPDLAPGPHAELTVVDTGVGMSPEVLEHLFEPFFTTKEKGRGTGLGLATVYGMVTQNHGAIVPDSLPGHGTRMSVFLPVADAAADPEAAHVDADGGALPRGDETLFVVEDATGVRTFAARVLQRCGFDVHVFEDSVAALAASERHRGTIHMLVTDVVMPGLNGRELADRLRERRPGLRVLYTSGYGEDVIAHHGVPDAGVELLGKPYSAAALVRRVRAVLDGAASSAG